MITCLVFPSVRHVIHVVNSLTIALKEDLVYVCVVLILFNHLNQFKNCLKNIVKTPSPVKLCSFVLYWEHNVRRQTKATFLGNQSVFCAMDFWLFNAFDNYFAAPF